jgi:hypothetical protein
VGQPSTVESRLETDAWETRHRFDRNLARQRDAADVDDVGSRAGFRAETAPRARWSPLPREFPRRLARPARFGRVAPTDGVAMGTSSRSAWSHVPQSVGPGRSECEEFAIW